MAITPTPTRDVSLVLLALLVAVCAMVCATVLALQGKISGELAAGILGTGGAGLAGVAIGRMSGANGETVVDVNVERWGSPEEATP